MRKMDKKKNNLKTLDDNQIVPKTIQKGICTHIYILL